MVTMTAMAVTAAPRVARRTRAPAATSTASPLRVSTSGRGKMTSPRGARAAAAAAEEAELDALREAVVAQRDNSKDRKPIDMVRLLR